MKHQAKPLLLVFPFGLLSHYLRCLVLAKHLSPYFKVKFASHPDYNHFVEQEGFTLFDCKAMNENEVMQNVKDFDFSWLNKKNLEACLKNQVRAIEELKPVAVLGDALPTLKMAAEYTGIHYISLINSYMSRYYADVRNISRTHPAYNLVNRLPVPIKNYVTAKGEAMAFKQVHKPFKKLRKKYNLKQQNHYLCEMEGDQTLLCDMPQLFPTAAMPTSFTRIGPLIYTGSANKNELPILSPDKKTIYVSMGSTGNWKNVSFLNNEFYSRFNVITACDKENVLNAPHIIKADFLNVNDVFPNVTLVICHGGNGTIYQALQFGIPLLCRTTHFEQEWNVAALEKAGLALSLDDITDERLLQKIIAEWTDRKDEELYNDTKQSINAATAQLGEKIAAVAQRVTYDVPVFSGDKQSITIYD